MNNVMLLVIKILMVMRNKMEFFRILLKGIGLDILEDEIIEQYIEYSSLYNKINNSCFTALVVLISQQFRQVFLL